MKFEQVNAWKMAGRVAASLALGVAASAQTSAGAKKGFDLSEVSLENDIRVPDAMQGRVTRPGARELELVFKMHPMRNSAPGALIPALDDMESSLVLRNGTPGAGAVIHLESRAPELRRAGGTRIVGFFDDDGKFEGQLPEGYKPRGIFAHGEEVRFGLVKKATGGRAVPASKRPVMEEVDVEELAEQTYGAWVRAYTNLEFRTDGKVRRASLEDQTASDQVMILSAGSLSSGAGHAQPGTTVEDDLVSGGTDPYIEPANPTGGLGALKKIPLQRPAPARTPAIGGGHTKPGSGVDDDLKSGSSDRDLFIEPANPTGGRRAGKKIELHRPPTPTRRDDKVLQRRL